MGRSRSALAAAIAVTAGAWLLPGSAGAAVATMSFTPEADTYVSSTNPTASFGTSTTFQVDGTPVKQSFLRFDIDGLDGRTVVGARLRMHQTGSSDVGGRVFTASSTGWTESMTWNTRPAIDGPQLGSFSPVAANNYYEADLEPASTFDDGPVTLAIDTTSGDDARWSSREIIPAKAGHVKAPRLVLEVESGSQVAHGLTQLAPAATGSSEPTYYPAQRRMALTESGRLLTVHGLHASGVQLAWRDPAGNWQNQTTGNVPSGILLAGTGTGDWPASIAVAEDSQGVEHAWVVYARASLSKPDAVYMRRLSDLDSPAGPTVGPQVAINAPTLGAYKPDIAFEPAPGGGMRGVVLWSRKASADPVVHETVLGWLRDLDTDTPTVGDRAVIDSNTSGSRWGTVVSADGMHALIRSGGRLVLFDHVEGTPLTSWSRGPRGITAAAYPSAVGLDSGQILSVVESDRTNHVSTVQRYSAAGAALPVELTLNGYSAPSIASDGVNAWIVMVRESDRAIVSRSFTPAGGWSATDRVEVPPELGGRYDYPNLLRTTDGRLSFVFEGLGTDSVRSAVFAFQRGL